MRTSGSKYQEEQNDTINAFPTASSSKKVGSDDCQESYFDMEDVAATTRAPSSHRSDMAPATSSVTAREPGIPKLDLPRCAAETTQGESRGATETTPDAPITPSDHAPYRKSEGHEAGRESNASPQTQTSCDPSSDQSPRPEQSPRYDSAELPLANPTVDARGDEKKKKHRWRPSMKRFSKRSSTTNSEENKKKQRSLRTSLSRAWSTKLAPSGRVRIKTSNANQPQDYRWLEATLIQVACNKANTLGAADAQTGKAFTPLFFVIGGCPNYFCGMQAIAYFTSADGEVDFWWVKPSKTSGTEIEQATLSRHAKGPHKNDPGRSKPFYKPLADMFQEGHRAEDGRKFFIEAPPGQTVPRAIIEEDSSNDTRRRLWVHLVWQEDWTSNPFSKSKYIKGKLVYQRSPADLQFYAREYCIKDGVFSFSLFEDGARDSVLPDESIKELYETT